MPALTRLIFPTQACINARMADTKYTGILRRKLRISGSEQVAPKLS